MPQPPYFCVFSLNPAIDAEWRVDDMLWEEKNMVHSQRRWAGGKGPNVARWLRFFGARAELLIPLGGAAGRELVVHLRADRLRFHTVPLHEETRVNVVITNREGRQMRFNQPGASVRPTDWRAIMAYAQATARKGSIILSGSLPPGAPVNGYAQIIRSARRAGARVFLDCDGPTLKAAVTARPFLVKPNRHELAGWVGRILASLEDVRAAAADMSRSTHGWVLVSLSEDGALLVNAREQFAARSWTSVTKLLNTLGAGDATLSGAASAAMSGAPPLDWLRAAVAAGTAATQVAPGQMPTPRTYKAILHRIRTELL